MTIEEAFQMLSQATALVQLVVVNPPSPLTPHCEVIRRMSRAAHEVANATMVMEAQVRGVIPR